MRSSTIYRALLITALVGTASAQLLLPSFLNWRSPAVPDSKQAVMNPPGIALPPSSQDNPIAPNDPIIISDVIGKERNINIFAGFTRDIESVAKRLEDGNQNTTVLAPLNSAITSLPRKPWEDPRDYAAMGANAYDGSEGEDRAHRNLRRFVEAHAIPVSPWKEHEKVETLAGGKIWFESAGGKKRIQPGDIEVVSITDKVSNGEVWVLKGVVNYA
ncbi:MAG: hypothetical protein M1824_005910 [Vezdaea acicularis]|nr:MAG: hypothetical protein M1824_005910 [Vezdaea acicularis]